MLEDKNEANYDLVYIASLFIFLRFRYFDRGVFFVFLHRQNSVFDKE